MLPDVTDFCRLILFRHPELAERDAGRAVGGGAAELSRRGRQSLLAWLELLAPIRVDDVVAPSQPQCQDAAAAIAAAKGVELTVDDRLRDQDLGQWQGRSWDELAAEDPERLREFFGEFGDVPAPGGESLGQAIERFLEWWTSERPRLLGKTVVLVVSGAMLSGFCAAMLGMRLSRAVSLNLPHGGVGILDAFENGVRVAAWNPGALG